MPAKPPSKRMPCNARARAMWSSGSPPCSASRRSTGLSSPRVPGRGRCSGIHAVARAANDSTLSMVASWLVVVMVLVVSHPDEHGESLAVLLDGSVQRGVLRHATEIEVEVVLPGHADAPVELHAVLDDRGAAVRDVRLRDAHEFGSVVVVCLHGAGARGRGGLTPF